MCEISKQKVQIREQSWQIVNYKYKKHFKLIYMFIKDSTKNLKFRCMF